MALTKTPIELSSTPSIVDGGNATAITIDSSEKVTMQGATTTIGSAASSTNVEFNINGVASKATRIQFQEGGANKWLLGQGAASETSAFELFNAGGIIALSVNRSTNVATFAAGAIFTDGNLVVANGHGIDFSATSGSGTSELLDDYEEGTWTPTTTTTGYTISTSAGFYTKIGNQVICWFSVRFSAVNGSSNSTVILSGAPFTVSGRYHPGIVREIDNTGAVYVIQANQNSTNIGLNSMDGVSSGSNRTIRTNETYVCSIVYSTAS